MSIDQFIDQYNPLEQLRRRESANSQMRNAIQQILPSSSSQKNFAFTNRKHSNTGTAHQLHPQTSMETLHEFGKTLSKSEVTTTNAVAKRQQSAPSTNMHQVNFTAQSTFEQAAQAARQKQRNTKEKENSPHKSGGRSSVNIHVNNNKKAAPNSNECSEAIPVPYAYQPQQHTEELITYRVEEVTTGTHRDRVSSPKKQVSM